MSEQQDLIKELLPKLKNGWAIFMVGSGIILFGCNLLVAMLFQSLEGGLLGSFLTLCMIIAGYSLNPVMFLKFIKKGIEEAKK